VRKSGKQRTYREAFLRFGATAVTRGYLHPGCFVERVWICLIIKGLLFFRAQKSLQESEKARVKAGMAGGVSEVCSR